MSVEAGIAYWSKLSTEELEDHRRRLQRDIDAGRHVEQKKGWLAEIDQVLEDRK